MGERDNEDLDPDAEGGLGSIQPEGADLRESGPRNPIRSPGIWKGKVHIADDFDTPQGWFGEALPSGEGGREGYRGR